MPPLVPNVSCSSCGHEHPPPPEDASAGDSVRATLRNKTTLNKNVQTANVFKKSPFRHRCPLPDHVLNSRALIINDNLINQKVNISDAVEKRSRLLLKSVQQIMQKFLEKLGLVTDQVSDPAEGLSTYQADPMRYGLVLVERMWKAYGKGGLSR